LTLLTDESGHSALHDVDVEVLRLLANQRRDYTWNSAKLDVEDEVGRLSGNAANREVKLTGRLDRNVYEAGFC
jgi:hypothetical protein